MKAEHSDKDMLVYASGLACMSVCVPNDWTREQVAEVANRMRPNGLPTDWQVSEAPQFAGGEPNPCPCNADPDNRTHYLVEC